MRNPRFRLVLAFALGVIACDAPGADARNEPGSEVRTAVIGVEGMSCISCVAGVRKSLLGMEGVREVHVSLEHRRVRVHFDADDVTEAQIGAAIEELGFHATPAETAIR